MEHLFHPVVPFMIQLHVVIQVLSSENVNQLISQVNFSLRPKLNSLFSAAEFGYFFKGVRTPQCEFDSQCESETMKLPYRFSAIFLEKKQKFLFLIYFNKEKSCRPQKPAILGFQKRKKTVIFLDKFD